ncbi:MAG: hypothetical protein KGK11_12275 [Sphingomonadales bacterium]|nr:hypothetical protein [Sphingomonadales bacterium]
MNRQIRGIPHFASLLAEHPRALAGWGRKPSGRRAVALSRWLGRPFVLLEDGFLRSVAREEAPRSLLIDDLGVYYDATAPSRMERAIAAGVTAPEAARALAIAAAWADAGLSKYNHAPAWEQQLPERYVLVADQCFGDLSVAGGLADARSFAAMLDAALAEWPGLPVLVKLHPEVAAGRRRGYLDGAALADPRLTLIGEECHPVTLVAGAAAIYAVSSLIGFEGLLHGRPVRCFGMPFYAGWGLTGDALPAPSRRGAASLAALVHAAFVALPRYVDPASGARCEAEQAIARAALDRAALLRARAGA